MSDMLNLTNTASALLHSELQTDTLTERQSLLTCVSSSSPVQPSSIEELRTWLAAAFPASHSVLPESKRAQTMPETCGLQQPTLFAQSDLPAFSWKTYQDYCNSTTAKAFSLTLPKWGMWDATGLYPQPMWEPDTDGNDCGLWRTPGAEDGGARGTFATAESLQRHLDNGHQLSLSNQVKHKQPDGVNFHHTPNTSGMDGGSNSRRALAMWPTPVSSTGGANHNSPSPQGDDATGKINLAGMVAMHETWPTPTSHLAKETGAPSEYDRNEPSITSRVFNGDERNGMALNPDWVEWLMGWPVGWSDIKPLATLNWRDWQTDPADTGQVPRVTDVKENRANRLKAIGNGQVPQCVVKAWELLSAD